MHQTRKNISIQFKPLKKIIMKEDVAFKPLVVFIIAFFTSVCGFSQDAPNLNDAQIASVAVTANQIDVDYGKIALDRSKNTDVREFANTMINDHNAIIKMAVDLATKLGVVPQDNTVTQSLLAQSKVTTKNLNSLKGKAFDKAYIENEIAYHNAVIDAVKGELIPQTQNKELKELLQTAVPILEAHYNHAKMTQNKIVK